ncbi:tyrosine recombinase XerS [Sutcliffiella sp. NPDC057660]|uniref:tyrosine recombinase XerS n=1 Tax=Sutcliffiella sp. NPDC057660 TaxID=3346199 RepID=UPI00369A8AB9
MAGRTREQQIHEKRLEQHLPSMPDYVIEFIRSKKRKKYSPSTLLSYVHEYEKFFKWLLKEQLIPLDDNGNLVDKIRDIPYYALEHLRKDNVEYYIDYLTEEDLNVKKGVIKKRSDAAIQRNINALKSLFNYLTTETENDDGECYFYRNVFSKISLTKKKVTASRRAKKISSVILSDKEIHSFIDFVKHKYEKGLSPREHSSFKRDKERDVALISLLLGSGIRVSEIASLLISGVDFKRCEIDIIRKGGKDDTADVLPSAMEELRIYLDIRKERYKATDNDPYVFLTKYNGGAQPISVRAIQNLINKYTKAFNEGKILSPHKLRHTFASEWIRTGGNIVLLRDQLGHSSIETTSLYTNLSQEERKKVINEMEQVRTPK